MLRLAAMLLAATLPVAAAAQTAPSAVPTAPPAQPVRQNQAPVSAPPAPFAIPAVAGVDRTFAQTALQSNATEIAFAQLALRRSTVTEVREYAERMINEHEGLADAFAPEIRRVLGTATAPPPADADRLAYLHLETIARPDFDQEYLLGQVGDHIATMAAFQTEADNGSDPALRALARKWMPTISVHSQLAVGAVRDVGGSSPLR